MKVTVNGDVRSLEPETTVSGLLNELGLSPEATVVQRNGDIVEREGYSSTCLADGDVLELVRFVGGG